MFKTRKLSSVTNPNMGFPGDSVVKNLPANAGDVDWTPGWDRSLEKDPHSSILAGKSHGQRILAGYSPQDRKELDTDLCN